MTDPRFRAERGKERSKKIKLFTLKERKALMKLKIHDTLDKVFGSKGFRVRFNAF